MKNAKDFTKKQLEDIINIENYIEEYKDDYRLIYLNDVPEAIILWEIQDQNGYPSDVLLRRFGTSDNPDICVIISGGDEYSSFISVRYSLNDWTAEEMYVDFIGVMDRWKKEKFVADEYGKYRHIDYYNSIVLSPIINKVINN